MITADIRWPDMMGLQLKWLLFARFLLQKYFLLLLVQRADMVSLLRLSFRVQLWAIRWPREVPGFVLVLGLLWLAWKGTILI